MTKKEIKTKVAPNSKESEMMVLGSMLTSINSLNVAADSLQDEDFYFTEHQIIFNCLKTAYAQDKPADIHIIAESLKQQNKLEEVGGVSYLTTLAQYAGTSAYVEEYALFVRNKSILRKMIMAAQSIEKTALEDPEDVHALLDQAQNQFFQISQSVNTGKFIHVKDLLSGLKAESKLPYLKEIELRQEEFQKTGDKNRVTGIATHFADLDKLINGFNNSNLMILAGRPAMGKTALALNLAENICFKNNLPTAIFSLEMTADQLLHRIICSQSEVESDKITTGSLDGMEYQRIVATANDMQKHTLIIDDQPGLKITDLRARARRMKEAFNIGFIVIDYLQLISGSGSMRSTESRQLEVSEISRLLKTLARELNIPVLCLSQLSRRVEERQGHRPMMSDLRESGCLAGDTLIENAETGEFYTLEQLANRKEQTPIPIYALDDNLQPAIYPMVKVFYSGKKTLFTLKTLAGKSIEASANHPFRTEKGWTRLDALHIGEKIATYKKGKLFWDEILSIQEGEVADVYDATVPEVHNFLANEIIVHNSLEQDSDLIFFIFRRDYYDPYDKPGLTELIIAKNRHGAVGTIQLSHRKEIAQFANYTPTEEQEESFSR